MSAIVEAVLGALLNLSPFIVALAIGFAIWGRKLFSDPGGSEDRHDEN